MKKIIHALLLALTVYLVAAPALRPLAETRAEQRLARLPAYEEGRLKPLLSVARNTLLLVRGKSNALDTEGRRVKPLAWLAAVIGQPGAAADRYRIFRVDNPDLLGLLKVGEEKVRHFTYGELQPFLPEIENQFRRINEATSLRTPFERAVAKLRQALLVYQTLESSFRPAGEGSQTEFYQGFLKNSTTGLAALHAQQAGQPHDAAVLKRFLESATLYQKASDGPVLLLVPPNGTEGGWTPLGQAALSSLGDGQPQPVVAAYARLVDSLATRDEAASDAAAEEIATRIASHLPNGWGRLDVEVLFHRLDLFGVCLTLYVLVFLLAVLSWLTWPEVFGKAAFHILIITFVLHTAGLAARIYLTGYAPVTNLYSSAVFVGWGATLFGLILEKIHRQGMGSVAAAGIGFCSLLIAHHLLAASGRDSMEMMRAVLDSNLWLSTHVITVTVGYSATFVAGTLAVVHLLRDRLAGRLPASTGEAVCRMVYGTICFALLFSFVGTVLGGIWADQSWGRFWGWDPKENGALMIVIWNALILHVWRIRMVGPRGFMLLAVGGNIVTSWSWFGTNLLGIGLHSYGFMESGFFWLMCFWASQVAIMLLARPGRPSHIS